MKDKIVSKHLDNNDSPTSLAEDAKVFEEEQRRALERLLEVHKDSIVVKVHRTHQLAAEIRDLSGNWHESAVEISAGKDDKGIEYEYYIFKEPPK